jgi:predicted nucleic acid-binding protein
MSLEPGILDTNVLIYAVVSEAPQHMASRALLDAVRNDSDVTFYVTSQILCEFYSVLTNPRRMTVARSSAEVSASITSFLAFLQVLPIPARAVEGWMDLLQRRPVTGADIFDLQLVAVMLANDVKRIYTFNNSDFEPFPELIVLKP